MIDIAGPHLTSLPSEARRPDWIQEELGKLGDHPDIELIQPGDLSSYENIPRFRVRDGHTLNDTAIDLTYYQYTFENWPLFAELRDASNLPNLAYQIGFPGTLQLPMFAFGNPNPLNGFRYRDPFKRAYQREVDKIWEDSTIAGPPGSEKNQDLIWQIEFPAEVGGMDKAPGFMQPLSNPFAARFFARGIVEQVSGLPEGARVVLHACNGDLKHEGFSHPRSAELITILINEIVKQWPIGRTLEGVHFPFASGKEQPSLEPAYYRPLGKLALHNTDTRFIAGFVHENATYDQQQMTRDMIEQALGQQVDVAPACGLGRRELVVARDLVQRCVRLVS